MWHSIAHCFDIFLPPRYVTHYVVVTNESSASCHSSLHSIACQARKIVYISICAIWPVHVSNGCCATRPTSKFCSLSISTVWSALPQVRILQWETRVPGQCLPTVQLLQSPGSGWKGSLTRATALQDSQMQAPSSGHVPEYRDATRAGQGTVDIKPTTFVIHRFKGNNHNVPGQHC